MQNGELHNGSLKNRHRCAKPVLAFVVALSASPPAHFLAELPNLNVVVFRHHPLLYDTEENMAARDRDKEVILKALKDNRIGFSYMGGLGRGYELSVCASDLGRWKKMVDGLIANKALKYYGWGLNEKGYGLVTLR